MRTNKDRLVMLSVVGEVTNPTVRPGGYRITHDGRPVVLPGVGGISYNLRVGDPAVGWVADHAEPGVSLRNLAKDKEYLPDTNYGLNYLACVGNEAVVGVTHEIPATIMGSGLGADTCYRGDYDIQLFDQETVDRYGLSDLRLGDLVAILDTDHSYGRVYKQGALSIGIVVHCDCVSAGHGPGVTTLFTCSQPGGLRHRIDPHANLADILGLRG